MERYQFVEWATALTSFLKHRIYITLSPTLLPTLHIPEKNKEETLQENTYDEEGKCKFCKLANEGLALYRDAEICVVDDRNPKTKRHLLVLPRAHYDSTAALSVQDCGLVQHMYDVGARMIAEEAPDSEYLFGFHVPPRMSVNHLHLHCMALPFVHFHSHISFNNWLWLMSPEDVLQLLEHRRVAVR